MQTSSASGNPDALVGVGLPDPLRGYADDPELQGWLDAVRAGRPVTVVQHNTMVASLAWCQALFSALPGAPPAVGLRDLFMSRAINSRGELLMLGATSYQPGSLTLPEARSAGAAALPTPSRGATVTVSDATRRRCFDATTRHLENLRLYPENLLLVPEVAPAGIIQAVVGAVIGIGVVGAGIYAAYRAHVDAQVGVALAEANARTEQVRIQQQAWATAQAAEQHARLQAYAMQLAYAQKMREMPALPAWASTSPVTIPQPSLPPTPGADGGSSGWSLGAILAALLGGAAVVGVGGYAVASKVPPEHRERIKQRASQAYARFRGGDSE